MAGMQKIKNFASLPTMIDISKFPTGILIYKLLGANDRPLETGKLVVHE